MKIGQAVRQLREAAGLSMYRLAERAGWSYTLLWLIETEKRENLSVFKLRDVAKALNVRASQIITLAEDLASQEEAA